MVSKPSAWIEADLTSYAFKGKLKKLFSDHFYHGNVGIIEFNVRIADRQIIQDTNPSI